MRDAEPSDTGDFASPVAALAPVANSTVSGGDAALGELRLGINRRVWKHRKMYWLSRLGETSAMSILTAPVNECPNVSKVLKEVQCISASRPSLLAMQNAQVGKI